MEWKKTTYGHYYLSLGRGLKIGMEYSLVKDEQYIVHINGQRVKGDFESVEKAKVAGEKLLGGMLSEWNKKFTEFKKE